MFGLIPTGRATQDGFPLFTKRENAGQDAAPAWLIIKDTPRRARLETDLFGRNGADVNLAAGAKLVDLIF